MVNRKNEKKVTLRFNLDIDPGLLYEKEFNHLPELPAWIDINFNVSDAGYTTTKPIPKETLDFVIRMLQSGHIKNLDSVEEL